uniref:Copia protein n=1 Tax=Tanacetum cinerariifolium TaxID=118510 RepID=A0A6L2J2C1_TANCI|nr:copia protein [Tanacetum cinerariifolium]
MKARRFLKNTRRKLHLNENETVAFDRTKVEFCNCHKRSHFLRKCRASRAENNMNKERTRRNVPVETTNSSALVCCNTLGEYIKKLKFEIHCNDITIRELRKKLEIDQREKHSIQLTIEKLKNASKSLNKLIDSQIVDNCKKGLGYNAVPAPYNGLFMPPKPDLSYIGLEKFTHELAIAKSDDEDEIVPQPKIEKKTVKPSVAKQRISLLGKKVEAIPKSAWTEKDQIDNFLNERSQNQRDLPRDIPLDSVEVLRILKDGGKGQSTVRLTKKRVIDSVCSRHMTRNMSYLIDYEEIGGRNVAFGGNLKGGKSLEKCFFNDIKCVVLSPDFELTDENHVLLSVPRKNNMYSVDLKNIIPKGGLTCLFVKATSDESRPWHKMLEHLNFKTMNKLVKENLVRGTKDNNNAGQARQEKVRGKDYILLPLWTTNSPFLQKLKSSQDARFKPSNDVRKKVNEGPRQENECKDQEEKDSVNRTNRVNVVIQALKDPSWIEAMQEELFQFKLHEVWTLVDIPYGKRAIGSKWVFKNKLDERGILIRNKVRLVAQGHTQEEGIDYDKVFAPVTKIEAIRMFLAYASFKDLVVYQMNVKGAFLYGKIK